MSFSRNGDPERSLAIRTSSDISILQNPTTARATLRKNIAISMDGRGRALDDIFVERLGRSVKYEDIHLKDYVSLPQLLPRLTEYFVFHIRRTPVFDLHGAHLDALNFVVNSFFTIIKFHISASLNTPNHTLLTYWKIVR